MPRKPGFKLNRSGVRQILTRDDELAKVMDDLAEKVGDEARKEIGDATWVEVTPYTTDRRAASVAVPVEEQARAGALTRAAAQVGLEVRVHE